VQNCSAICDLEENGRRSDTPSARTLIPDKEFLFMRNMSIFAVSIAFATCILFCPDFAQAQNSNPAEQNFDQSESTAAASQVAAQMVPAQAVLSQAIDATKMQPGQQFQAKLSDTVHLKNGVDLPKGTDLVGTVATDKMGNGESTLALRFTKANLKDGKAVPIEATIVGIAPPAYRSSWDGTGSEAPPIPWNGRTLQIDDIGVLSGVDLHSTIAGQNSAVFVTKKDHVKLASASQLSLAIAPGAMNQTNGGE
jgi:hypothetical protein